MVLHFQICSDAAWTGKDKLAVSFLFALALPSHFEQMLLPSLNVKKATNL